MAHRLFYATFPVAAVIALALAGSAAPATGCTPAKAPRISRAVRIRIEANAYTYTGTTCTRFGWGFVAWTKGTSNPKHPTNSERILIQTRSDRFARKVTAFYRSSHGAKTFLKQFKAALDRPNPQWTFDVRITRAVRLGTSVELQAFARASHR